MLTMRKLIMHGILAIVLAAAGIANGAPATRVIRFGLISDVHVTDKRDQATAISRNAVPRYYTGGVAKLEAFALAMNRAGAAFVAELGDLTDGPEDESLPYEKRKSAVLGFLETAESKLALFKGPKYHVLGNHDTDLLAKEDARAEWTDNGPHLPRAVRKAVVEILP
jgi:alkaline phosphatase